MMDLILWRHAEAFEMREVDDDLARALTPKGERQAQRMADWLNQRHSLSSAFSQVLRQCIERRAPLGPELQKDLDEALSELERIQSGMA